MKPDDRQALDDLRDSDGGMWLVTATTFAVLAAVLFVLVWALW